MDLLERLDEEHREVLKMIPEELLDLSDVPRARAILDQLFAAMAADAPVIEGVTTTEMVAKGKDGNPDVTVRVHRPDGLEGAVPGLCWIHGGGMVLGYAAMDDVAMQALAASLGLVAVAAEYRLAPEHPYPAPLEDCYTALRWMVEEADSLGIDAERVAIGGASAGGGLAAGLALLARDRDEVSPVFQLLIYPMIDDRNVTDSSINVTHPQVWHRDANIAGWAAYLGELSGTDQVPGYAAPARATDLAGLPPAYIVVGEFDLFLDEDMEYARRLIHAGVPVELHVFPGAFHGSDAFVPMAETSQRWAAERDDALRRALFAT